MGSNKLISLNRVDEKVGKDLALSNYIAIDNSKILLLIILMGGACFYLFMEKDKILKEIALSKGNRIKYFRNLLAMLYGPVFIGIGINLVFKTILFFLASGKINGEVSFLVIGTSFIYLSLIVILTGSLFILGEVCLKNNIISLMLPIFMIDIFIIIFSIGSFFIGEAIPMVKEFINLIFYPMIKLIDGFFFNFKFELMYFENELVIMLLIGIMSGLTLLLVYKTILGLTGNNYNLEFKNKWIRKFMFISVVSVIALILASGIGIFISLFLNIVEVDKSIRIMGIIALIAIPFVYIEVEKVYQKTKFLYFDELENSLIKEESSEEAMAKINFFEFSTKKYENILSKLNKLSKKNIVNNKEHYSKENKNRKKKNSTKLKK